MSHTEPRFRPLIDRLKRHFREHRYSFGVTWNYPVAARRFLREIERCGPKHRGDHAVRCRAPPRCAAHEATTRPTSQSLSPDASGGHPYAPTAGVQLVAAGVDITVIRSWLGHVSLDTTNHYARANIETKRRALELVDRSTRPSAPPTVEAEPELAGLARLALTRKLE